MHNEGWPNADALDDAMDRLGRGFAGAYGLGRPPGQSNEEALEEYLASRRALRLLVERKPPMRRLDAIIDWIFRWHRVLLFASVIVVFLSLFLSGRAGAQELVDVTVPVSPLPGLSNAQLWVIVAPILIVVFGTFLRNLPPQTPDLTKRLIVGAAAAILAAGGLYAEGRLDFANWFGTFLTILFLAGGYFAILWKPFQDGVIFKIRETAVKVSGPDQGKVVDTGA